MTAARNSRLTDRQLADFGDRFSCGEILKLRAEAAALGLTLPQYLCEAVRHRRADLIRETVAAERPEGVEV
jgi:hypothetical protein